MKSSLRKICFSFFTLIKALFKAVSQRLLMEDMPDGNVQKGKISKKNTEQEITYPERNTESVLRCFYSSISENYLNVVMDNLDCSKLSEWESLFFVFATLLAEKTNLNLRIITRKEMACKRKLLELIDANELNWVKDIEFEFVPYNNADIEIPIGERNIFLTASSISAKDIGDNIDNYSG